jgi:hypothetical protein
MALTQFGLWARNLSKTERVEFADEQRCVISLYERHFPGVRNVRVFKVLVDVVETVQRPNVGIAAGVALVEVPFDLRDYFRSGSEQKKRIILELLQDGVRKASKQLGWPLDPFEEAYRKVQELDYKNEWTWQTKKWNSVRTHSAEIYCLHEIDRLDAYMIVRDADGREVKRVLLFSERPNEFQFADHLGKLKWTSTTVVELLSKGGERRWTVELNEQQKESFTK